jgi:predicted permease
VVGWGVIAGFATVLLCALVPLAVARRQNVLAAIQSGARALTEGRRSRAVRAGLVAIEIAASVTLVCGAALMTRTVVSLLETDLGIETDGVLTASLTLRQSRYPDESSRLAVFDRILEGLNRLPGVESAALMSSWPLQQPMVQQVGADQGASQSAVPSAVHVVSDGYFETLAIGLTGGRVFGPVDRAGGEPVAIVSETFAGRAWPDGSAVGRRLFLPDQASGGQPGRTARLVVGVVRDVRQDPADQERGDVYVPLRQSPSRFAFALVRTRGTPEQWLAPLRAIFRDVDPEIALARVRSLASLAAEMRARPQFLAWLLACFAAMAGLVAIVGIYGTMAYAVRQREREIAVRMAIGATRAHVTRLLVRQAVWIVAAGVALGIGGARAGSRLLESQLFGVAPGDPVTLAVAAGVLGACGLAAAWWPARRAAQTDPAVALRVE